jgi:putative transposase
LREVVVGTLRAVPGIMAHPLRWFVPDTVYEFTSRTIQERFLLRPSVNARQLVLGVIARGLMLYPAVQMHAFAFLSNHWHTMLSSSCGAQMAAFMGYVNSNVAREMGRIHRWRGRFWARRTRPIPILDDVAMVERLRYLLAQGVKEGLVAHPEEWPGATSTPWLLGQTLVGIWIDRDLETRARRYSANPDPTRYTFEYELRLSPLPCWAELTREEIAERTRALMNDVVTEAQAHRRGVAGVDAVLRQDPHSSPLESKRGPAPACHASTLPLRVAFRAAYRAFIGAFRAAADALKEDRDGASRLPFPAGSFPARAAFVQPARSYRAPWLQLSPDVLGVDAGAEFMR